MSWNKFPNHVSKSLLHRLRSNSTIILSNNNKNDIPEIIFRLPNAEKVGGQAAFKMLFDES